MGPFLLRAQLDCQDRRLPRVTFDLKSRATAAIRMSLEHELAKDYKIKRCEGLYESFEREDYDLLRSLLLKYR